MAKKIRPLKEQFKLWYKMQPLKVKLNFHWQCFLLLPIAIWVRCRILFDKLKKEQE